MRFVTLFHCNARVLSSIQWYHFLVYQEPTLNEAIDGNLNDGNDNRPPLEYDELAEVDNPQAVDNVRGPPAKKPKTTSKIINLTNTLKELEEKKQKRHEENMKMKAEYLDVLKKCLEKQQ